ncbi:hypothetical protein WJX73_002202 [Symbiochloris irregularis]|uniref:Uncharacterized protein n=1 Tax=Symbiochloris irregularis TaxID=706552 RepID=A0AAW1PEV1_9CHLO
MEEAPNQILPRGYHFAPALTMHNRSREEDVEEMDKPELKAYKLGEGRYSYNCVKLTIFKSFYPGDLSMQAIECQATVDHFEPDYMCSYLLRFKNEVRCNLNIVLVYDQPIAIKVNTPEWEALQEAGNRTLSCLPQQYLASVHEAERPLYAWPLVERHHCQPPPKKDRPNASPPKDDRKGKSKKCKQHGPCEGKILKPIERLGIWSGLEESKGKNKGKGKKQQPGSKRGRPSSSAAHQLSEDDFDDCSTGKKKVKDRKPYVPDLNAVRDAEGYDEEGLDINGFDRQGRDGTRFKNPSQMYVAIDEADGHVNAMRNGRTFRWLLIFSDLDHKVISMDVTQRFTVKSNNDALNGPAKVKLQCVLDNWEGWRTAADPNATVDNGLCIVPPAERNARPPRPPRPARRRYTSRSAASSPETSMDVSPVRRLEDSARSRSLDVSYSSSPDGQPQRQDVPLYRPQQVATGQSFAGVYAHNGSASVGPLQIGPQQTEEEVVWQAQQASADPLPLGPGQWQGAESSNPHAGMSCGSPQDSPGSGPAPEAGNGYFYSGPIEGFSSEEVRDIFRITDSASKKSSEDGSRGVPVQPPVKNNSSSPPGRQCDQAGPSIQMGDESFPYQVEGPSNGGTVNSESAVTQQPPKRGRGRPRKHTAPTASQLIPQAGQLAPEIVQLQSDDEPELFEGDKALDPEESDNHMEEEPAIDWDNIYLNLPPLPENAYTKDDKVWMDFLEEFGPPQAGNDDNAPLNDPACNDELPAANAAHAPPRGVSPHAPPAQPSGAHDNAANDSSPPEGIVDHGLLGPHSHMHSWDRQQQAQQSAPDGGCQFAYASILSQPSDDLARLLISEPAGLGQLDDAGGDLFF